MADEEPAASTRRRNRNRNRNRGRNCRRAPASDSSAAVADLGSEKAPEPELSIEQLYQEIEVLEKRACEAARLVESRSDDEHIGETRRSLEQIDELTNKILDLKIDAQPIPDGVLIAFIMAVDKADRYFDLKDHLRRYFDLKDHLRQNHVESEKSEDDLAKKVARENPFNNDEEDIWHAVHACLMEVRHQEARKGRAQYVKEYEERELRNLYGYASSYTAEQHKEIERRFPGLSYKGPETTDGYVFSNPISTLVFQAREKGYVMDVNPQVELRKIMRHHPSYYHLHFIYKPTPIVCLENMVLVSYNSHVISMYEIVHFLSPCGKIVHYECKSKWKSGITYITFKDSNGAKRALSKDASLIKGEPIGITQSQPAAAPNVERAASDDEALDKYSGLRLKYKKQSDDVKDGGC